MGTKVLDAFPSAQHPLASAIFSKRCAIIYLPIDAAVLKRPRRKAGAEDKVYKCHSFFRVNRDARGKPPRKQPLVIADPAKEKGGACLAISRPVFTSLARPTQAVRPVWSRQGAHAFDNRQLLGGKSQVLFVNMSKECNLSDRFQERKKSLHGSASGVNSLPRGH